MMGFSSTIESAGLTGEEYMEGLSAVNKKEAVVVVQFRVQALACLPKTAA